MDSRVTQASKNWRKFTSVKQYGKTKKGLSWLVGQTFMMASPPVPPPSQPLLVALVGLDSGDKLGKEPRLAIDFLVIIFNNSAPTSVGPAWRQS